MISPPSILTIETSSACNLRCVMCPQSIDGVDRPKKMPVELMDKILPYIKDADSVALHGIGEPLLSKSFWTLLKELPVDAYSTVNTNLTVLTDEMLSNLLSSNLKMINVSIDSPDNAQYQWIRGFDLDVVLANVRRLVGHGIQVYANMTLMMCNVDKIIDFMDLMIGDIGCDAVCVWPVNRWTEENMAQYNREIRGWVFNYENQGLWNCDAEAKIAKAQKYADKKGWTLLFNPESL